MRKCYEILKETHSPRFREYMPQISKYRDHSWKPDKVGGGVSTLPFKLFNIIIPIPSHSLKNIKEGIKSNPQKVYVKKACLKIYHPLKLKAL